MLELIFQGGIEWLYGLVLECAEYFSSALLDVLSLDFAYIQANIPVIEDIRQILLAVGWALLLGNLVFQAARSMMTGIGFEAEDPKLLFTRTFVFSFLLLASPQICELVLSMTSSIMVLLDMPDSVDVALLNESLFGALGAAWLIVIIGNIIILFKILGLVLEIVERYVILAVLTMTAPLAFAMGGSRSTSDIFTGWCRMYGSMCFLMVSNVIFFKMLLSVLSSIPSGLGALLWLILVITIVKVAKKADVIITRIGLNPAITGDGLSGRSLPGMLTYAVFRTMAQTAIQSAGKTVQATATAGTGTNATTNTAFHSSTQQTGSTGTHTTQQSSQTAQQTTASQRQRSQNATQQRTVQTAPVGQNGTAETGTQPNGMPYMPPPREHKAPPGTAGTTGQQSQQTRFSSAETAHDLHTTEQQESRFSSTSTTTQAVPGVRTPPAAPARQDGTAGTRYTRSSPVVGTTEHSPHQQEQHQSPVPIKTSEQRTPPPMAPHTQEYGKARTRFTRTSPSMPTHTQEQQPKRPQPPSGLPIGGYIGGMGKRRVETARSLREAQSWYRRLRQREISVLVQCCRLYRDHRHLSASYLYQYAVASLSLPVTGMADRYPEAAHG